jgi:hypothetical protein
MVGWSAAGECIGGKGDLVTGWGEWERKVRAGREWMRRGRKSSWEGEQWILAQEKERE